jgi:biopolymer transport protein ExbD
MRIRAKHDSEIHEGDLTPLIDMTFQLIAFFMLLINFTEIEKDEEVELASSALAKKPDAPPKYKIRLNLKPDGRVSFSGMTVDSIANLAPILGREISSARRQEVAPGEIDVIIRADKKSETGIVQDLIAECQKAGLEKFLLRVNDLGRGRLASEKAP